MKPDAVDFDLVPRVVLEGATVDVRIQPLSDQARFDSSLAYEITHRPMEDLGSYSSFAETRHPDFKIRDGALVTRITFEGEQEHSLVVECIQGERRNLVGDFRLYSVAEDLFRRRPCKGDLHIHSIRSDGREEPGYVAASCRKIGLDFMALTDHGLYEPSIESQKAFAGVPIDLEIFRGEEVHPPNNPIHIINFGGDRSVNDMFKDASYALEVKAIVEKSPEPPPGFDPYVYASSLWCFDKIRETGGMGIFCHPYWIAGSRYHIPGPLTSKIFDEQPYDAFELIGGYHYHEAESNMLQVLRYQEESAKGRRIPVVGVSDAHGCERGELFGWYYTVVFSESLELANLVSSIKSLYSVAVEHLPGNPIRCHGPLRMCKYAHFLLREVMPGHDALCREEGLLMLEHFAGNESAAGDLAKLSGRTAAYLERYFKAGA